VTRLADQNALVTGGGSGIGRATAICLARRGVNLCLTGRNRTTLEAVAAELSDSPVRVVCAQADVSDDRELHDLVAHFRAHFDGLDILVHNAGTITVATIAETPLEEFDRQVRVNLRAPFLLTQLMLAELTERKGQVVFVNSTVGLQARSTVGAYAATKHGLRALADALRAETGPAGVRVISAYLGRVASPMQRYVHEREGAPYRPELLLQPDDVARAILHALDTPRSAELTDFSLRTSHAPGNAPR
jgi:NAD(P)-dependent dehydrogenase (short-subunit alcohol dehydrogenase family)